MLLRALELALHAPLQIAWWWLTTRQGGRRPVVKLHRDEQDPPRWRLVEGEALAVLRRMKAESVDAVVTDPPAGIEFMGEEWDSFRGDKRQPGDADYPETGSGPHARAKVRHGTSSGYGRTDFDTFKRGRLAAYKAPPGGTVGKQGDKRTFGGRMGSLPPLQQKANRRCVLCGGYQWDHEGRKCSCPVPQWAIDNSARETFIACMSAVFAECLRVLKPGGHALVWALPRTSHWTATALEDAGFEVRDVITHHFGTGFPKSLDVAKAIDKARGDDPRPACRFLRVAIDEHPEHTIKTIADHFGFHTRMVAHWAALDTDSQPTVPTWEQWIELKAMLGFGDDLDAEVYRLNERKGTLGEAWQKREVTGQHGQPAPGQVWSANYGLPANPVAKERKDAPGSEDAARWQGWGTALKPGAEHWILVRKPLARTVAQTILRYLTGALNIDGCRVPFTRGEKSPSVKRRRGKTRVAKTGGTGWEYHGDRSRYHEPHHGEDQGRWPANVLLSHAAACEEDLCSPGCPIAALDLQSGPVGGGKGRRGAKAKAGDKQGLFGIRATGEEVGYGDAGGASRFFPTFYYAPKASAKDRSAGLPEGERNQHPTVKSTELMRWLCRLVTPPGGLVLDPFTGSGSTGVAAQAEGFRFVGIERKADYVRVALHRLRASTSEGGP